MIAELKKWAGDHKALAAGGGLAVLVIIFLWLRGSSSQQQPADGGGGVLAAYYAAQASNAHDAAAVSQSTNALAAATNQTNAARDVALAQIAGQKSGVEAQLKAHTDELNLVAYQDYLAELAAAGPASSSAPVSYSTNFADPAEVADLVKAGGNYLAVPSDRGLRYYNPWSNTLTDPVSGFTYSANNQSNNGLVTPGLVANSTMFVNWSGVPGEKGVPVSIPQPITAPILRFNQFTA